jgi:hypothetical protein
MMEGSGAQGRRVDRLSHTEVQRLMQSLGEAKVVDLDKSFRDVMEPVSNALKVDPESMLSLHIVCCNEYALVTP